MVAILREELDAYRACTLYGRAVLVFRSSKGDDSEPEQRAETCAGHGGGAREHQAHKAGVEPIPNLTPHPLRRTVASLLFALDETPPYVMSQMGHTTANLTLAVLHARQMNRRDGEPERLKALVNGVGMTALGRSDVETAEDGALQTNSDRPK